MGWTEWCARRAEIRLCRGTGSAESVDRDFGRRTDMQEDITYCANTDCKNMDWDKQNNKVLQRAFEKFKGLLEEGQ